MVLLKGQVLAYFISWFSMRAGFRQRPDGFSLATGGPL